MPAERSDSIRFNVGSLYFDGKYLGEWDGMAVEEFTDKEGPDVLTRFQTHLLYHGNIIDVDAEVSDVG